MHPAQPRGAVFVYIVKALGERGGSLYGFSQNSRPGVYGGSAVWGRGAARMPLLCAELETGGKDFDVNISYFCEYDSNRQ